MAKNFRRIAVAGATMTAVLALSATPALADTDRHLTYPDGKGTMTYFDDGDMFQVCDTKADGHGMTGVVESMNRTLLTIDDGGDAGCDKKGYNVGSLDSIRMGLSWEGGGGTIYTGYFHE